MANSFPRVSVAIPSYNRAQLLKETVDSVLRQTIPAYEIIVVDDGSTDATHDLVRSYGPPVVLVTQNHAGEAAARNRGLAESSGEWIAFIDSDDIWRPTKIEQQLQYLHQHPSCGLVHTDCYAFGAYESTPCSVHFLADDYKVEYLLMAEDWICISSALIHKGIQLTFREWAKYSTDILFFAELLRAGVQFGYVNEPLVGYRTHFSQMNVEANAQTQGASVQWRWVREEYASDPQEQERLQQNILTKGLGRLARAKHLRDWTSYWEWRKWLTKHWPLDLARPNALGQHIYPPAAYKVKDTMNKMLSRFGLASKIANP